MQPLLCVVLVLSLLIVQVRLQRDDYEGEEEDPWATYQREMEEAEAQGGGEPDLAAYTREGKTMEFTKGGKPILNVFWIGNSYTSHNDLPQMFAHLANARKAKISWKRYTPGGVSLGHGVPDEVKEILANNKFDFVILQDQSQIPGFPLRAEEYESTQDSLNVLNEYYIDAIHKAGAIALLYQTWGRQNGCKMFPQYFPNFVQHNTLLKEGYHRYLKYLKYKEAKHHLGKDQKPTLSGILVGIAPVGDAFEFVYTHDQKLWRKLYAGDDGGHPSVYGTYLAACVFWTRVFHEDPVNEKWKPKSISVAEAIKLQEAAKHATFHYQEACEPKATCHGNGECDENGDCVCAPPWCGLVCANQCVYDNDEF